VEAYSVYEAAAAGFKQLREDGHSFDQLVVTVHEPGNSYHVRPSHVVKWASRKNVNEAVGVTALKHRVIDLIRKNR
jgi:intein-encoded DNA endonuclease-like protein